MKKMLMVAAAACLIGLGSCNKDGENYQQFSLATYNYVSNTGLGQAIITPTLYSWTINYDNSTMTMVNTGVSVGIQNVGVKVEGMKFQSALVEYEGRGGSYFAGNSVSNGSAGNGMEVTGVNYEITPLFNLPPEQLSYTADASAGLIQPDLTYSYPGGAMKTYTVLDYKIGTAARVRTFWPDLVMKGETVTSVNGVSGSEFKSDQIVYRVKMDVDKNTATLVIYNAQFNSQMPKMSALIIPGLRVRNLDSGIEIDGIDIKPLYIEGGRLMENPNFPFNTIHFASNDKLTGGTLDFTVAGRFTGSFTGKGVLTDESKEK